MPSHSASMSDSEIPVVLKWVMTFINRIGFPIVAFGVVSYLCFVTIEKLRVSMDAQTQAIVGLTNVVRDSIRDR